MQPSDATNTLKMPEDASQPIYLKRNKNKIQTFLGSPKALTTEMSPSNHQIASPQWARRCVLTQCPDLDKHSTNIQGWKEAKAFKLSDCLQFLMASTQSLIRIHPEGQARQPEVAYRDCPEVPTQCPCLWAMGDQLRLWLSPHSLKMSFLFTFFFFLPCSLPPFLSFFHPSPYIYCCHSAPITPNRSHSTGTLCQGPERVPTTLYQTEYGVTSCPSYSLPGWELLLPATLEASTRYSVGFPYHTDTHICNVYRILVFHLPVIVSFLYSLNASHVTKWITKLFVHIKSFPFCFLKLP